MTLTINIKESPNGTILIVTDTDLLGKKFEGEADNGTPVFLDLTSSYYSGKEQKTASTQEILEMAKGAYILHLTGHAAIAALEQFVPKEDIIIIQDVPHIQVFLGE